MTIRKIVLLAAFTGLSGWLNHGMGQGIIGGCPSSGVAVISASATSICPNTSVTFTVTNNGASGGGTLKGYNWLVNGNSVGSASTFTTSSLNNGDQVRCITSSQKAGCTVNFNPSNVITMTVTTLGTPTAPSGSTSLCQGTTSTAYTSSASNATSYTWSLSPSTAGTISGSSTTGTVTWNTSYTGTATVSVVANGCSSSSAAASTTVTVSPTVATPTVTGPVSLCQGSAATNYPATATGATSFSWSLSPSSAAIVTGDDVEWVAAFSGTAILTVSAAGCGGPKTTTVTITVTPNVGTPSAPSGTTTLCQGGAATAYTTSAASATSYSWTLNPSTAGTISGTGTTGTVTWNSSFSGTASVGVVAIGCSSTSAVATTSVTVTPTVGTPSAPSGSATVCQASAPAAYVTSASNATSYAWSISPSAAGSISGTSTTGTVTWSSSYNGTATISVTANGCNGPSAAATKSVTVTPTVGSPSAPVGTTVLCQASAATPYTTSATNATSYTWSISPSSAGTISGTGITGTVSWSSSFTGSATLSVTANGCNGPSAAASKIVTVTPSVAAPSAPSGSTSFCQGSAPVIYTTETVNNAIGYTWSISPTAAGTISGSGTSGTVTWSGSFSGTALVGVVVTGCNASTTPVTTTVTVQGTVGAVSAPSGPAVVDNNRTPSTYTVTAANATGYNWSALTPPEAGTLAASGASAVVTWNPLYAGSVTFSVSATGCGGPTAPASTTVTVYQPLGGGTITPGSLTIATGTDPGLLTASGATGGNCNGSYNYQWLQSTNGLNFVNAAGNSGNENYDPGILTSTMYYERQVSCGTDKAYTNIAEVMIGTPPTASSLNYIRVRTINKPGVTDTVTADGLTSPFDVQQSTQYFDGLGRPIQTVAQQTTPLGNDLVQVQAYDPFGREVIHYLPYAATTSDGNYKPTALAGLNAFNATQFPGEQFYYGQTDFEPSPLNRPATNYSAGMSWVGSGRGVSETYEVNYTADSVVIWNIAAAQGSLPTMAGFYPAGQLYKNVSTDEAGHQVVEYKDNDGLSILRKVQLAAIPGTAHVGWLCTYYVYDDLNLLRFVIPPQAVAVINTGTVWTIPQATADALCFRYEYDSRNRTIIKKIPGAGEAWTVYDARDRVVMTQDANQRVLGKWLAQEYDSKNRPDSVGLLTDNHNLAYHQNLAAGSTYYPVVSGYPYQLQTVNFYDTYTWVPGGGALSQTMNTSNTTNSSYFITGYNISPTYSQPITYFPVTRGQLTGTFAYIIGSTTGQVMVDVNFFDDHSRVIQTESVNITEGVDLTTTQYDFSGKSLRTLLIHNNNDLPHTQHIVVTKMSYDPAFRLKSIFKNIDGAASDQLIDSMQYNELGQLRAKYMGNKVDSLVSAYNIRGWLTGINPNYVAGTSINYFGMELGYDKLTSVAPGNTYATPEFTGNMGGTVWKSAGSGVNRKYDFSYDAVNRLTGANFNQYNGSGFDKSAKIDFSVSNLNYDGNGNILTMSQRGFTVGGSNPIDSLTYSYGNSGISNQLAGVKDAVNSTTTLLGDFHYNPATKQATDYSYDGNGNLHSDNNKAIDSISYNYLNLPQSVHMNGKGTIVYTYDAKGTKWKKTITDSLARHSTTILYLGGFVYQQNDTITQPDGGIDTLQFIAHEEGRARWAYHKYLQVPPGYRLEYDFYEKDHLGNTRMVLTQEHDTTNYLASMEYQYRATEAQLFGNIASTCVAWTSMPNYQNIPNNLRFAYTSPNDSVSKVDYTGTTGQTTGPSLLLKVMAGDTITPTVQCYYVTNTLSTTNSSLNSVLNSLATGILGTSTGAAEGTLSGYTSSAGPVFGAVNTFLSTKDVASPSGYPKAYLNWILLDDQFNYVSSSSGSVATASSTYPANQMNLVAPGGPVVMGRNGYLYVWVSNETQGWDVFFDDFVVQYKQGPVLEENHYYPFGLTMAGISDKAVKSNYAENKYRYNGKELQHQEFSDGTGLEEYDFGARFQDPQLGIWHSIDPKADQMRRFSPYNYAYDNPIRFIDPDGKVPSDFYDEDGNLVTHVDDHSNAVYKEKGDGVDKHYVFQGFDESQGGLNKVNLTTAIQEAQNLNMTNEALDPTDQTFCNYATQDILRTVASATNNSDGLVITGKANEMVPKMEGSSLLTETDKSTAEANAKKGGLSLLGYINHNLNKNGTEKHGHVATFSVGENAAKGEVANIGSNNGFQGVSAEDGDPHIFSQKAAAQVKYFTLNPTVTPKQAPQYVPIGKYPQQQNDY